MAKEKSLKARVAERIRLIKQIIKFIDDLLLKHGRLISQTQGSSNTRTIRDFDIGALTFYSDTGKTMMGGNDYTILRGKQRIFDVHYQSSIEECEVHSYSETNSEFRKIMSGTKKMIARIKKEKERHSLLRARLRKDEDDDRKLKTRASRLGL